MEAGFGFSLIVRSLLNQECPLEPMYFGFVPAFTCCIDMCQCFREHRESCLWLSHNPMYVGKERQKIGSSCLCSRGTPSCQALGELLDPFLCPSLQVCQRPA